MKCPHCKKEVPAGKYCANCSRPLFPKWYQKNSKLNYIFLAASLVFLCVCIFIIQEMFSTQNPDEANAETAIAVKSNIVYESDSSTAAVSAPYETQAAKYESILDEYAKELTAATSMLIDEFNEEASRNKNGSEGLADLVNEKIAKLAEINVKGTEEMESLFFNSGSGKYEEYEEWASDLYNIYLSESQKIMNNYTAYVSS